MTPTLTDTAASFSRRGLGVLRTAGAVIGGLGLAGIAAGGAALAWGSIERTMPTLRRYDVPIERDVPEVTILQIADLHLFAGQEFLLHFLSDVASSERFDMVVATGDNFGSLDAFDMVMDAYRPFLSYPGAFVLGSNDYYSPIPKPWTRYLMRSTPPPARVVPDLPYLPMVRQMRDAGWVDLSNASGTLSLSGGTVSLLGTDDAHIFRDRMVAPASSWEEFPSPWDRCSYAGLRPTTPSASSMNARPSVSSLPARWSPSTDPLRRCVKSPTRSSVREGLS